jgi:hypothetical protein
VRLYDKLSVSTFQIGVFDHLASCRCRVVIPRRQLDSRESPEGNLPTVEESAGQLQLPPDLQVEPDDPRHSARSPSSADSGSEIFQLLSRTAVAWPGRRREEVLRGHRQLVVLRQVADQAQVHFRPSQRIRNRRKSDGPNFRRVSSLVSML